MRLTDMFREAPIELVPTNLGRRCEEESIVSYITHALSVKLYGVHLKPHLSINVGRTP